MIWYSSGNGPLGIPARHAAATAAAAAAPTRYLTPQLTFSRVLVYRIFFSFSSHAFCCCCCCGWWWLRETKRKPLYRFVHRVCQLAYTSMWVPSRKSNNKSFPLPIPAYIAYKQQIEIETDELRTEAMYMNSIVISNQNKRAYMLIKI